MKVNGEMIFMIAKDGFSDLEATKRIVSFLQENPQHIQAALITAYRSGEFSAFEVMAEIAEENKNRVDLVSRHHDQYQFDEGSDNMALYKRQS